MSPVPEALARPAAPRWILLRYDAPWLAAAGADGEPGLAGRAWPPLSGPLPDGDGPGEVGLPGEDGPPGADGPPGDPAADGDGAGRGGTGARGGTAARGGTPGPGAGPAI